MARSRRLHTRGGRQVSGAEVSPAAPAAFSSSRAGQRPRPAAFSTAWLDSARRPRTAWSRPAPGRLRLPRGRAPRRRGGVSRARGPQQRTRPAAASAVTVRPKSGWGQRAGRKAEGESEPGNWGTGGRHSLERQAENKLQNQSEARPLGF